MAFYKYSNFLAVNSNDAFDTLYVPGLATPHSGIYRCEVCGREDVSETSKPLPPQNHHQHNYGQGPIRWRLIVCSDGNAK